MESALDTIHSYSGGYNMAVITSFHTLDGNTSEQNESDNKELAKRLRDYGFIVTKIDSYYNDNCDAGGNKSIREESYYLVCPKNSTEVVFEKFLKIFARDFKQQSVLIWSYEKREAILWFDEKSNGEFIKQRKFDYYCLSSKDSPAWTTYKRKILGTNNAKYKIDEEKLYANILCSELFAPKIDAKSRYFYMCHRSGVVQRKSIAPAHKIDVNFE